MSQNNDFLGSLDFGGSKQAAATNSNTGFGGNPFGNQEHEEEADVGGGWANMGAFGSSEPAYSLDFASPKSMEVVQESQKGQGGKSGLQVRASFTQCSNPKSLGFKIQVINFSSQLVNGFDLMFNKNPFGIAIQSAKDAITFPPPGSKEQASATLSCIIDKKNLDAKNPPTHPFKVQVAMKTSLDIFYFEVPCPLHCLIDFNSELKQEEFKKFWEMIPKQNETTFNVAKLYTGFLKLNEGDIAGNLSQGLRASGFTSVAQVPKGPGNTMLYFGAKTINNLPLLLEINAVQGASSLSVLYRVPVLPLKPMLEDALA